MLKPEDIDNQELVEAHQYFVNLFKKMEKVDCFEVLLYRYSGDFYMKWQGKKKE